MKLSDWANENKITYKTAWRWFHQGVLPVKAMQLKNGTIFVLTGKIEHFEEQEASQYRCFDCGKLLRQRKL